MRVAPTSPPATSHVQRHKARRPHLPVLASRISRAILAMALSPSAASGSAAEERDAAVGRDRLRGPAEKGSLTSMLTCSSVPRLPRMRRHTSFNEASVCAPRWGGSSSNDRTATGASCNSHPTGVRDA